MHGAPYIFSDKEYWYTKKTDVPWEMFQKTINKFTDCRKQLVVTFLVMLDESMVGWRPKVTLYGGLPNITFEPRKPEPLGTMLRDCVDCITGTFVCC